MSSFPERLVHLRNERNITQEEFAKIIGVSKSTVSMYENGNRTPTFETEEKIADYFNVDLEYLRGRSDIKNSYQQNDSIGSKRFRWVARNAKKLTIEDLEKLQNLMKVAFDKVDFDEEE